MGIKLTLDSTALAELVKDDEVRLNLTQSVVEEFSRRHLKSLINHELFKKLDVTSQVREQVSAFEAKIKKDLIGPAASWMRNKVELSDNLKNEIRMKVSTEVSETINIAVKDAVTRYNRSIEEIVEAKINMRIDSYINSEIERRFDERLAKLKASI